METDRHYFLVGLFIIGLLVAGMLFAVWIEGSGHRDDVLYRIRFADSVSGLSVGDPVKYRGLDVGTVEAMAIDPDNDQLIRVDVRLRKDTPVRTDTQAHLKLKGITGVVNVELTAGSGSAPLLRKVTPKDQVPEIPAEQSSLTAVMDELPKLIAKFSSIEDQMNKLLSDRNIASLGDTLGQVNGAAHNANDVSAEVKADPTLLLFHHKKAAPKSPTPDDGVPDMRRNLGYE
ncbi:MAG: MlaD family protein [Alphaproteobacteria bacterium]